MRPTCKALSFVFFTLALFVVSAPAHAQQLNSPQGNASLNWSGYVAKEGGNYTSVTGTWIVPVVSADTPATADATWVGIGGTQSRDLIQAGTQAIVTNGSVYYVAWIEMLPGDSIAVPLEVTSGDSITATLTAQATDVWQITLQNNTKGTSYSRTVTYSSSLSSAEWIEEMVSNSNGTFRPLDSFGTVGFTNASATVQGQSENLVQLGATPLQMVNGNDQALATVSSLGADDASFSVVRTTAQPTAEAQRSFVSRRWHIISTATSTSSETAGQVPTTISIIRSRHMHGFSVYISGEGLPSGFAFSILRQRYLDDAASK